MVKDKIDRAALSGTPCAIDRIDKAVACIGRCYAARDRLGKGIDAQQIMLRQAYGRVSGQADIYVGAAFGCGCIGAPFRLDLRA